MKTLHNFNLASLNMLPRMNTLLQTNSSARHLNTHTHTNIEACSNFKNFLLKSMFCTFLMMAGTGNISGQPAGDPCDCSSWSDKGTTDGKSNISDLLPILDCTRFKGKIVIDTLTYFSNLSIRMETRSEIEVNAALYISDCNIGTCDDMWKGITVIGGEESGLISVSESEISGAEIAVRLTDESHYSFYRSDFVNNYIGISTGSPFESDPSPMEVYPDDGIIQGCHFYTENQLPDPYPGQYYYPSWPSNPAIPYDQGYAAFYITGSTGLNLGQLDLSGAARNKIYNMRNGIVVRDATTEIMGTDFMNFEGAISKFAAHSDKLDYNQRAVSLEGSMCHIQQDSFINVMIGVHSTRSSQDIVENYMSIPIQSPIAVTRGIKLNQPTRAFVAENDIYNGYMGIDISDSWNGGLEIEYNDLFRSLSTDNNVGISLQRVFGITANNTVQENEINITGARRAVGISMNNVSELNLYQNTIDFLETGSLTAGTENAGVSGLMVFNSLIAENYITGNSNYKSAEENAGIIMSNSMANDLNCNQTDEMHFGIHIIAENMATDLKSNEIYDAANGLQFWSPVTLGPQKHFANKWLGAYSGFGAFINGDDPEGTASASPFIADASDASPGVLIPDVIGPMAIENDWFFDVTGEPDGVVCNDFPPIPPLSDSLVKLVRHPFVFTDYVDEMNWMRKADILTLLHMYPAYLANTVLDSFFDAEATTALGELIWAEFQMSKGHGMDSGMPAKDSLAFNYLTQVRVLDSMIALNPINVLALKALRILKIDTLSGHYSDWRSMLSNQMIDTEEALEDAVDVVDNVTPTNDLETDLQILLGLQGLHFKGDSLTTGELEGVYEYARQCPWLGARSMAEAQILYSLVVDSIFTHRPGDCSESEPFNLMGRSEDTSSGDGIRIYPNPASNIVYVQLPDWAESLMMLGVDGREWLKLKVSGAGYSAINTRDMPSGIYSIRIQGGKRVEATQLSLTR